MKYTMKELTASQLGGPVLSIRISKCFYMVNTVWQTEEKDKDSHAFTRAEY